MWIIGTKVGRIADDDAKVSAQRRKPIADEEVDICQSQSLGTISCDSKRRLRNVRGEYFAVWPLARNRKRYSTTAGTKISDFKSLIFRNLSERQFHQQLGRGARYQHLWRDPKP